MPKTTLEIFTATLVEQLGVDAADVKLTSRIIDDLGADSLDTVELIMAAEEDWGINIPDEEAEQCTTVGAAVDLIDRLAKEQNA